MAASRSSPQAFVVASKRTPFGTFGGKLRDHKASELGGFASKAALDTLPKDVQVDSVVFGNVVQTDTSGAYLARHVGHYAHLPVTVPALTLNRLCGSGFQSVITAAQQIQLGESNVVLTGGAENMSMAPYTLHGSVRWGTKYGVDQKLVDSLAASLVDQVTGDRGHWKPTPMGVTAENLAKKYGISRADCDAYALQSQQRWAAAQEAGAFKNEIAPMEITHKRTSTVFDKDEHPRPSSTLESLGKLGPVFHKEEGVVTAGNSSGIGDGAAANVVASEDVVKQHNLKPLARIVSWGITACEPTIMGIGPVEAIKMALSRAGKNLSEIGIIDVNEAFAAQFLSVAKGLELPMDRTNMFGGAIALAHPLGASGARIVANLVHNMQRLDVKYGLGAACIGGGQGIAVLLEKV
ncbi:acetyl-coenzyme A acyltransferase 2 [Dacryopinax primogenitus]|uniref:Acetyl-coenzyme A acyltransferase 2 n=1 Tax=Dacryopinax primogenitus (strain DJM 731) TaxID=1858805 RepID=M5GG80_DACPD|nr:acetyl-coenzyme A acyltransferase 2 [Dacryopinax primogenitus]EJU05023.1 acetyl-coenzyme A acyltransferase 2 [Dacryopinax primogenitus]